MIKLKRRENLSQKQLVTVNQVNLSQVQMTVVRQAQASLRAWCQQTRWRSWRAPWCRWRSGLPPVDSPRLWKMLNLITNWRWLQQITLSASIIIVIMTTLKVFTNYRNFGAMYQSKNNFKKAEWAFKNGIKQAVSWLNAKTIPMLPNPIICFDLYVFAGHAFAPRLVVRFCGARSSCELSSEQSSSSDFREQSKAGDGKYHLDILRCAKSKVKQGVLSLDLLPLLLFVFVCCALFLIDDHHRNRNDNGTS